MKLTNEMKDYLKESREDTLLLIRELCAIPAPSNMEEKRAEYCKKWFLENGAENVEIDQALNVICSYGVTDDNDITVFMAHTDTVFPDTAPLPFKEEDGKYFSPGVCDDTANLAVLMICARYFLKKKQPARHGLVFVANSGEEGLGNLKGSRAICARYGNRLKELITIDGISLDKIVTRAVGSHRYRVSLKTEGGHSFANFGNRNAIHALSSMISTLYTIKVPKEDDSITTYNVGAISGGTSVNTIAENAEMLYEYRSNNKNCLEKMKKAFFSVIEAYRAMGISVDVELIGERPCASEIDKERYEDLISRASESILRTIGREALYRSGSTDCNIPLSLGIPSICISGCSGGRCHTRDEFLIVESLQLGTLLFMDFLSYYFI